MRERIDAAGATGLLATLGLVGLSGLAVLRGLEKVLIIGWVAFAAMAIGAWLGARAAETNPHGLVWGYGLASGAMVISAALFLVPQAIGLGGESGAPQVGGLGVGVGLLTGYSAHVVGHRLTHLDLGVDVTSVEITAHAVAAGAIIGLVYGSLAPPSILLGLSIVSHKGPAGYAAARRLQREGGSPLVLLLPAAGVGLFAIPTALVPIPASPLVNGVVFGFAAGIFLHVAMDFLPTCEAGSEIAAITERTSGAHELLDRLRTHAVASTVIGGTVVAAAWALLL